MWHSFQITNTEAKGNKREHFHSKLSPTKYEEAVSRVTYFNAVKIVAIPWKAMLKPYHRIKY